MLLVSWFNEVTAATMFVSTVVIECLYYQHRGATAKGVSWKIVFRKNSSHKGAVKTTNVMRKVSMEALSSSQLLLEEEVGWKEEEHERMVDRV
ncbi:hypothetical protein Tco_0711849 [Tanacetum coccineum]